MIQTSLAELILYYLFILLGIIFTVWIFGDWARRKRERRLRDYQFVCNICGIDFVDKSGETLVKCPTCNSLNEKQSLREI